MSAPEHEGTSSAGPRTPPGGKRHGEELRPLLNTHAALVLTAASIIVLIMGGLTYLSTGNTAAAVLTGLMSGGAGTVALHKLIGP